MATMMATMRPTVKSALDDIKMIPPGVFNTARTLDAGDGMLLAIA